MEHLFQEQVAESLATVTDLVIIFSAILCKIIPAGFLSQNFLPKVHSTLSFHSNCECLTTLSSNCLHLGTIFPALSSSSRVTYPYGYLPSLETTILWCIVVVLVVRVLAIGCPCVLVTSSVKVDVVSRALFQNSAVLGFPNEGQERPVWHHNPFLPSTFQYYRHWEQACLSQLIQFATPMCWLTLNMIEAHATALNEWERDSPTMYVPVQFWFTMRTHLP